MKKTILLIPLIFLFMGNISAMHRKSMRKMYDRKRYQKKTKGQKFLQSRKYNTIARHKNTSRKKKINSADEHLADNQYTAGSVVKNLVPRFRIDNKPLLSTLLFTMVLANIIGGGSSWTFRSRKPRPWVLKARKCDSHDIGDEKYGTSCNPIASGPGTSGACGGKRCLMGKCRWYACYCNHHGRWVCEADLGPCNDQC